MALIGKKGTAWKAVELCRVISSEFWVVLKTCVQMKHSTAVGPCRNDFFFSFLIAGKLFCFQLGVSFKIQAAEGLAASFVFGFCCCVTDDLHS